MSLLLVYIPRDSRSRVGLHLEDCRRGWRGVPALEDAAQ